MTRGPRATLLGRGLELAPTRSTVFLIRRAKPEDSTALLKLARTVHFINLPADKEIIDAKIAWSRQCFMMACESDNQIAAAPPASKGKGKGKGTSAASAMAPSEHNGQLSTGLRELTGEPPAFLFVLEDTDNNAGAIGTSQIISRMGGPGKPNLSLQLSRRQMFSQSLQVGAEHTVAQMHRDESGPTEIGGLILQHSYRGHRQRLGRLLSIVRFHFMGLHRQMFSSRVLAELMGMISADGRNPFWEYCTRCFINMSYDEADRFCQFSKEFILSLFPPEPIYLTLIAPQARNVVGKVGAETEPAKRMLEKLGFKHHNRVDPFDGGPHFEASTDEIPVVRDTKRTRLAEPAKDEAGLAQHGIVSVLDEDGEFRAVQTSYGVDRSGRVVLPKALLTTLATEPGVACGVTPVARPIDPVKALHEAGAAGTKAKPKRARKTSKRK